MDLLRRVLYWEAAIWLVLGVILALIPKTVVVTIFDQALLSEYAWVRMAGIQAVALALLMVLVGQRVDEIWWFSWVFLIAVAGIAILAVVNAAFGVPQGSSALLWWLLSGLSVILVFGLAWGLASAGGEKPAG